MEFAFDATIDAPLARVRPVLRDRLSELVPFLPTIAKIELLERGQNESGRLLLVRLWEGNSKMIPPVARPFVTRAMRTWRDVGLWSEDESQIEWRFEPFRFAKLFTCGGTNYLDDLGGRQTRIRMTGELVIHAARVPGISEAMARRLAPKIERWAVGTIKPNLLQVPRAVQSMLDGEQNAVGDQDRDQDRDQDHDQDRDRDR